MAGRIQGITVEIGGDTTKLTMDFAEGQRYQHGQFAEIQRYLCMEQPEIFGHFCGERTEDQRNDSMDKYQDQRFQYGQQPENVRLHELSEYTLCHHIESGQHQECDHERIHQCQDRCIQCDLLGDLLGL